MTPRISRDPTIDRSLRRSVRDGFAWSVMFGAGESYLAAFAVFLKATTTQVSLLAALPSFIGSLCQLAAAWVAGRTPRRKPLILGGVLIQALMWLPIIGLAFIPSEHAVTLLIACVAVYYAGIHFSAPPWNSLMGDLVPERRRGRFFGMRTRIVSIATFASLTIAGVVLQVFEHYALAQLGFALIFAIAFLARVYSMTQLHAMHEPPRQLAPLEIPRLRGIFSRLRQLDFARFTVFFALFNFAVAIASPFFTLYMLRDLKFSYLEFTAVSAIYVLVQFATLNLWGRLADVFGNRLVMAITAWLLPIPPLLWMLFPSFWAVMAIQLLGGMCWAGMTLAANNYFMDVSPPAQRAAYSAVHQTLSHGAIFGGALVGGFLGTHVPAQLVLWGTTVHFVSGLWAALFAATIARAVVVLIFMPTLREVRSVRRVSAAGLAMRVIRWNMLSGLLDRLGSRRRRRPHIQPTVDVLSDGAPSAPGESSRAPVP